MSSHSIAKRLGERLRALRLRQGLTQQDLADRVGVSPPEISKYERARRAPSLESLAALAEGLGLPLSEVVAFEGSENASPELQRILHRLHGQPPETVALVARLVEVVAQDSGGVVQDRPERRDSPR
ncbi:MAG: helix-turn-helix transcriptional regulator [Alphaproteobacteria bacterium]|nr:helix-turn-helix transcriptional regulator [Alphaproteobacteria bacterium]MCB9794751.1 helix-turn-helix transcriptional regulator [Alphaproteobacteria bacterium]